MFKSRLRITSYINKSFEWIRSKKNKDDPPPFTSKNYIGARALLAPSPFLLPPNRLQTFASLWLSIVLLLFLLFTMQHRSVLSKQNISPPQLCLSYYVVRARIKARGVKNNPNRRNIVSEIHVLMCIWRPFLSN